MFTHTAVGVAVMLYVVGGWVGAWAFVALSASVVVVLLYYCCAWWVRVVGWVVLHVPRIFGAPPKRTIIGLRAYVLTTIVNRAV